MTRNNLGAYLDGENSGKQERTARTGVLYYLSPALTLLINQRNKITSSPTLKLPERIN